MANTLNSLIILTAMALISCSGKLGSDTHLDKRTEQGTEKMINEHSITSPFFIRTYFVGGADWADLTDKFTQKYERGFSANLLLIDDAQYENLTINEIINKLPEDYPFAILFIADSLTFTQSDNTVLCVDLDEEPGRFFRVIPSELWSVENNLSIANMDYNEFYENCDEDGIFRGVE